MYGDFVVDKRRKRPRPDRELIAKALALEPCEADEHEAGRDDQGERRRDEQQPDLKGGGATAENRNRSIEQSPPFSTKGLMITVVHGGRKG